MNRNFHTSIFWRIPFCFFFLHSLYALSLSRIIIQTLESEGNHHIFNKFLHLYWKNLLSWLEWLTEIYKRARERREMSEGEKSIMKFKKFYDSKWWFFHQHGYWTESVVSANFPNAFLHASSQCPLAWRFFLRFSDASQTHGGARAKLELFFSFFLSRLDDRVSVFSVRKSIVYTAINITHRSLHYLWMKFERIRDEKLTSFATSRRRFIFALFELSRPIKWQFSDSLDWINVQLCDIYHLMFTWGPETHGKYDFRIS